METFVAAAVFIALAMLAMAVGVIFSNKSLRGSCGGTGAGCGCAPAARARCLAGHAHDHDHHDEHDHERDAR